MWTEYAFIFFFFIEMKQFEGASFCLELSLEDPSSILAKFCNLVQPFSQDLGS